MSAEAKPFPLEPNLPPSAAPFMDHLRRGLDQARGQIAQVQGLLREILADLALETLPDEERLSIRLFFEIIQDFVPQGWGFQHHAGKLIAIPPEVVNGGEADQQEVKKALRASLITARDEQLRDPATRRFVLGMERSRWHRGRQVSVLNLFLSPQAFGLDLQRRLDAPEAIRQELLKGAIDPYLQMATEERDESTNLRLIDIWRYCRYTWSLPLSSQPGRQMHYLVRDRSRAFHPIVGIGALGSSIVQITSRDEFIGWSQIPMRRDPSKLARRIKAFRDELDHAIDEILWSDFSLTDEEVARPTAPMLERLEKLVAATPAASRSLDRGKSATIVEDTHSSLYRRKRGTELHRLLRAKHVFQHALDEAEGDLGRAAEALLVREEGRQAVGVALRSIKKSHIGSSMMDITTCGAIPPYSDILGGKLVALLMASPQVVDDYQRRYRDVPSEIASRMKGAPVIRPAHLTLLGTTSLYYIGSSQYNRLKAPAAHGTLEYLPVGKTLGFGSVHLSQRTYRTLQLLLRTHPKLESHSYSFAAGVNYKLRSIATGLGYLNLTRLQQHKTPRLVYLAPLATNWREYLSGLDAEPTYIYADVDNPKEETQRLIDFWKQRWFYKRIQRRETLYGLRQRRSVVRVSAFIRDEHAAVQHQLFELDEIDLREPLTSGGSLMQPTIPWQTLAQLKDQRASFAERLTPQELEVLHVNTKLDDGLIGALRPGRRIYVTGNPGDGKTHIIRRYEDSIRDIDPGAFVNLDASAEDEDALVAGVEDAIATGRLAVVAINEGPLRRLLTRLPQGEKDQIREQLDQPYLYDGESSDEPDALVVNLGLRQVLASSLVDGALQFVLQRVDYRDAPEAVQNNRDRLSHPRVRRRLHQLLELVARGGAHVTMHELLGFLAYIVTGGEANAENAARIARYYELAFSEGSPLQRWLRPLDPAAIAHPLVDMRLWEDESAGHIEWVRPLQGPAPLREVDRAMGLKTFHARKRQYYFEASYTEQSGDDVLEMLPEDRATFYKLLGDSRDDNDRAKARVLRSLAHFFGGRTPEVRDDQIQIWTSLRYEALAPPTAFIASQMIVADRIALRIPRLRSQMDALVEYIPSHVRLAVQPVVGGEIIGLDIDLDLWLALMALGRGLPQRHHDPVVGRRLSRFMSRLSAAHDKTLGQTATIHVRDINARKTYSINLAPAKKKYLLKVR